MQTNNEYQFKVQMQNEKLCIYEILMKYIQSCKYIEIDDNGKVYPQFYDGKVSNKQYKTESPTSSGGSEDAASAKSDATNGPKLDPKLFP